MGTHYTLARGHGSMDDMRVVAPDPGERGQLVIFGCTRRWGVMNWAAVGSTHAVRGRIPMLACLVDATVLDRCAIVQQVGPLGRASILTSRSVCLPSGTVTTRPVAGPAPLSSWLTGER